MPPTTAVAPLGAATLTGCGGIGAANIFGPREATSIPNDMKVMTRFATIASDATMMLITPIAVMIPGFPLRGGGAAGHCSGATGMGAVGG